MEKNIKDQQKSDLNSQQLQMIELFKDPMPKEEFNEIKRAIVKLLARRIDEEMEILEKEKGWTSETYEKWGEEHSRIPYDE